MSITCTQCRKTFSRQPWAVKRRKHQFCCHKCYSLWLRGKSSLSVSTTIGIVPTNKQIEFIMGTLLGDGYLHLRGKQKNAYLQVVQVDREFVTWKKKILGKLAPATIHSSIRPYPRRMVHRFNSGSHPVFTKLHKVFYPNGIKIVPKDIGKYLTDLSVAAWYMDDGNITEDQSIRFATNAFTLSDCHILVSFLTKRYNTSPVIYIDKRGNQPFIGLNKKDSQKILSRIKRYIIPSMRYKLYYQGT